MKAKRIAGIFAPITTPFVDEEISLDQLVENLQKYSQTNLAGYLVLGSNGENLSLNDQEKAQILRTVVQNTRPGQAIIAGIACESTRLAVSKAEQAATLGAGYISLLTPSYFKSRLTDSAFIRHFIAIAEASPLPVFLYNAPKFTGVNLSPGVITEVSHHPNIVGIKDSSPGNIIPYLEVCAPDFCVLAGSLEILIPALYFGATGGVVSLANAFPDVCCELYELAEVGERSAAEALFLRLHRLSRSISGSYAVAGVKCAMDLAGYNGGAPRLPLLPLNPDERDRVRKAILAAELNLVPS